MSKFRTRREIKRGEREENSGEESPLSELGRAHLMDTGLSPQHRVWAGGWASGENIAWRKWCQSERELRESKTWLPTNGQHGLQWMAGKETGKLESFWEGLWILKLRGLKFQSMTVSHSRFWVETWTKQGSFGMGLASAENRYWRQEPLEFWRHLKMSF